MGCKLSCMLTPPPAKACADPSEPSRDIYLAAHFQDQPNLKGPSYDKNT